MAIETFTWQRQAGATGKIMYRIIKHQFGDGYSQAFGDGINVKQQQWPLAFKGNMAYVQPIIDFFDRHAGHKSFYWQPPGAAESLLWRVDNVTLTSNGGGVYTVGAEFTQVYAL